MTLCAAPSLVNIDPYVAQIKILVQGISMANTEAMKARASLAQCKLKVGQNIQLIKEARPHNWIQIVKDKCGLRRRAAYTYLSFAEGEPVERHRAKNRERVAKHRALRNAQNEARQAQISKLNAQVDRLRTEIAELQDGKALKTENAQLHATLKKVSETLGVAVGLTGHFEHDRAEIIHKLNQAKNAAEAAPDGQAPAAGGKPLTLDNKLFAQAMSAPTSSEVH
jgi:dynactin complex subunit